MAQPELREPWSLAIKGRPGSHNEHIRASTPRSGEGAIDVSWRIDVEDSTSSPASRAAPRDASIMACKRMQHHLDPTVLPRSELAPLVDTGEI